jgi:hypothetical protein
MSTCLVAESSSQDARIELWRPSCSSLAGWMELVREPVQLGADLLRPRHHLRHLILDVWRRVGELLTKHTEFGGQQRDPLPHVIVQLPREAGALMLVRVDHETGPGVVHPHPLLIRLATSFI